MEKKNGYIWLCYFKKNKEIEFDVNKIKNRNEVEKIAAKSIGYISYKLKTGQIGLFFIDNPYRNRGLGKQILTNVICDLKSKNVVKIWAVTTENHPFWSNVYNKSFKWSDRPHTSVTGHGYIIDVTNEKN